MGLAASIGLFACGALGACSHTFFQMSLDSGAVSRIGVAMQRLNAGQLEVVVDLRARHAIEILFGAVAVQAITGDDDHQFDSMARVLFLAMVDAQVGDPLTAFNQDLAWMGARVGRRVATSLGGPLGALGQLAGGLAEAVGVLPASDDASELATLRGSLAQGQIQTCGNLRHIVSYRSGILRHIHADLAEQSPEYLAWRDRVDAMHLLKSDCANNTVVLMLFADNHGDPEARVIGWHFMTAEQYSRLEPRLRQTLDL